MHRLVTSVAVAAVLLASPARSSEVVLPQQHEWVKVYGGIQNLWLSLRLPNSFEHTPTILMTSISSGRREANELPWERGTYRPSPWE